jgi:hypothetical protein
MPITPQEALQRHDPAPRDLPRRDGRADGPDHARRGLAGHDGGAPHRAPRQEGNDRRDHRAPPRDARARGPRRESAAPHLVDIVGTGGDGAHTFNISTGFDVRGAAAGARVAKHGNRSVSSKSGSADVLEALGARIDLRRRRSRPASRDRGRLHVRAQPPSRHAARGAGAARDGVRTLFNILGR